MIKVLHFYKTYYPDSLGGAEQVIFQLAEGGRAHGIESQVLYLSKRGDALNETMGHHRSHRARKDLDIASTGLSVSALRLFRQLAADVDVIHYHFPWPYMDVVHFATRVNKPMLITYHSDIVRQSLLERLYRPLMKRFFAQTNVIVASSPNYVASSPVLQNLKGKVRVIPFGLSEATLPSAPPQHGALLTDSLGNRFFLFVGVLRYYKGLNYLLEAAARAPYPIVIAGDGPCQAALRKQAARLNLSNVVFAGRISEAHKAELLRACTALVFPSHLRSEAFGISLLEAAMAGKPLISCEIGTGTSYINLHGETGLVVRPADPQALVEAMRTLWDDQQLCATFGRNARARALTHFSVEKMTAAYALAYRDCIEMHGHTTAAVVGAANRQG